MEVKWFLHTRTPHPSPLSLPDWPKTWHRRVTEKPPSFPTWTTYTQLITKSSGLLRDTLLSAVTPLHSLTLCSAGLLANMPTSSRAKIEGTSSEQWRSSLPWVLWKRDCFQYGIKSCHSPPLRLETILYLWSLCDPKMLPVVPEFAKHLAKGVISTPLQWRSEASRLQEPYYRLLVV